ncbi:MAG: PH domain-containing protein [Rhizomicrobium sp.]
MVGYVERVLQPGETLRYEGTVHWIIFLPAFALLGFAIAGLAAVAIFPRGGAGGSIFFGVVVLAFVIGTLHLLIAWIRRHTTEIAVTNRRIICKTGLISRRTVEMNMDKVESVDVTQDVFGRLLDYGTVLIRGTGAGLEPLDSIAAPLALRNAITAS